MRAKRTDANQTAIVQALRKVGCSVTITSMVGDGFPDIVVGVNGKNFLLEIKDKDQPPSKRVLTPEEKKFHEKWGGHVETVYSVDDALNIVILDELE